MRTLITSLLLFIFVASNAQSTSIAAPAESKQAPTLSAKAKELCKTWNLSKTETFDLVQDPTEAQKGDLLMLMESGRYRLVYEGKGEGGTWTIDKSNVWLTLKTDDGAEKKFKIISSSATELKVDYRDGDGTHNILVYTVAK